MKLILASGSPRRLELLHQLGLTPSIQPADIDESVNGDESPDAYVERLAREKCVTVVRSVDVAADPDSVVIGADTTVTIDGEILGKPTDRADAIAMLDKLSDRTHEVLTGIAVGRGALLVSAVETTLVTFGPIDSHDAAWYVDSGEPMDKAGAYAIQGAGGLFVRSINGSADNVVGLPRHLAAQLFEQVGLRLTDARMVE